ncbi:MAG: dienelactone hydrolase family protein [Rhizomicrobium sp.]
MSVKERKIEIPIGGGSTEAYLFHPDRAGGHPGVLFLTDIMGIREANLGMARRIAGHGYTVLVPNVFWRAGKLPVIDFEIKMGEERTMKRFGELFASLLPDQMSSDSAVYLDFLARQPHVRPGKMGVAGYCFTGAMAMRAAAVRPDQVAAAASFHGGGLASDQLTSPHLFLPRIEARLYFGHAVEDRSMTPEMIARLDGALKAWGGTFESEVYDGARHGWTVPGRDVYDEKQAERHYGKLFDTFDAALN